MTAEPETMLRTLALVEAAMDERIDDVHALLTVADAEDLVELVVDLLRYAAGATGTLLAVTGMSQDGVFAAIRSTLIDRAATS